MSDSVNSAEIIDRQIEMERAAKRLAAIALQSIDAFHVTIAALATIGSEAQKMGAISIYRKCATAIKDATTLMEGKAESDGS